jgi:hypothetical protein
MRSIFSHLIMYVSALMAAMCVYVDTCGAMTDEVLGLGW